MGDEQGGYSKTIVDNKANIVIAVLGKRKELCTVVKQASCIRIVQKKKSGICYVIRLFSTTFSAIEINFFPF